MFPSSPIFIQNLSEFSIKIGEDTSPVHYPIRDLLRWVGPLKQRVTVLMTASMAQIFKGAVRWYYFNVKPLI